MIAIENLTDDNHQQHTIIKDGGDVTLTLRYHDIIQQWTMDVSRNGIAVYGVKLSNGVRHIESWNMGVDFIVYDSLESGLDPFRIDDFSTGRCSLVMIDAV